MTKHAYPLFAATLLAALCVSTPALRAQGIAGVGNTDSAATEQEEAKKALAEKKAREAERDRAEAQRAGGAKTRNDLLGTVTNMATPKPPPRKQPEPIIVDVDKVLGRSPAPEPKAPLTVDDVLNHMEQMRKGLETFTADVVKTVYTEPLDDTETFAGQIQFKLPRLLRMRLVLQTPEGAKRKEIIYIVGPRLAFVYRVHDGQAEGVELKNMKEKIQNTNPLEYGLSGDVREWRKTYDLKVLPEEKLGTEQTAVLLMRPKGLAKDETEGTVTLWLSQNSWLPVRIREVKNDGDIVETHTFSHLKRDVKIPDKVFQFEPDDEVDVIIHAPD